MIRTRVIPSLLIKNSGLVKTIKFNNPKYIGDPINAIRIFNEKEVDELVIFDIGASLQGNIDYTLLNHLTKEAFMPLGYGGCIKSLNDAINVLSIGFEKIIINSIALSQPSIINKFTKECGSQSLVVCIDYITDIFGTNWVFDYKSNKRTNKVVLQWALECVDRGAGEIILYSKDRDGTFNGYDICSIKKISNSVPIPIIALGGASSIYDFKTAVIAGASAVAAGSLFIYYDKQRAVLINYPEKHELNNLSPILQI